MKTNTTRAPIAVQKPRTPNLSPAVTSPLSPATLWAWPGLTRAELRELIIDQIG